MKKTRSKTEDWNPIYTLQFKTWMKNERKLLKFWECRKGCLILQDKWKSFLFMCQGMKIASDFLLIISAVDVPSIASHYSLILQIMIQFFSLIILSLILVLFMSFLHSSYFAIFFSLLCLVFYNSQHDLRNQIRQK